MKFNLTAHRELWLWLAENPLKEKSEWPGWVYNGGPYEEMLFNCPACQYARCITDECTKCPLVWVDDDNNPVSLIYIACDRLSLYGEWKHGGPIKRAVIARQIANLKVREGVETI